MDFLLIVPSLPFRLSSGLRQSASLSINLSRSATRSSVVLSTHSPSHLSSLQILKNVHCRRCAFLTILAAVIATRMRTRRQRKILGGAVVRRTRLESQSSSGLGSKWPSTLPTRRTPTGIRMTSSGSVFIISTSFITIKGGSRRAEKSREVLMMKKAAKLGWAGSGAAQEQTMSWPGAGRERAGSRLGAGWEQAGSTLGAR